MIISEVVITAIAFVGAYYIFKPLLKPKDQNQPEKESENKELKKEDSPV